ncbi:hypothetical protein ABZ342_39465 [Amycolatopsis sp. NPDC005961]|uniref:hypothetical protein n=1 Tax=Amycolatopsis sp. NPDC005961 TaxID=3156720 RepID=UPI0033F7854E
MLAYLQANRRSLGVKLTAGEPNWYNVQQLSAIASGLGLSNSSQIVAAVGTSGINLGTTGQVANPIEDVRLVRNFIAHKTHAKIREVRALADFGSQGHVYQYLWAKTLGGVERFSMWVNAFRVIADTCCW